MTYSSSKKTLLSLTEIMHDETTSTKNFELNCLIKKSLQKIFVLYQEMIRTLRYKVNDIPID